MLVIARRIGESIRIGEDIEVKVIDASRSRVVVAIAAPRSIRILRVNGGAEIRPRGTGPELAPRAAYETIRQRRFKVASR